MKHVIAGQTDEDVIEWRLSLDEDGEPRLKARKGKGRWHHMFEVEGNHATFFSDGFESIGLKTETL